MSANFILNVLLYGFYMFLWVSTTLWFLFAAWKWSHPAFVWGAIFISIIYLPGQFLPLITKAGAIFVVEFVLLSLIFAVYISTPAVENQLSITGRVYMYLLVAMMFVNGITLIAPGFMDWLAIKAGTIEGYALDRWFIRTQILYALFVLQCIGVFISSLMDLKKLRDEQPEEQVDTECSAIG